MEEEKLKDELNRLLDRLGCMEPKSEDYKTVMERVRTIEEILYKETERSNSLVELKRDEKKISLENDKIELENIRIELEQQKLEFEKKSGFKGWILDIGGSVVKTGLKVIGIAGVMILGVVISDSGHYVPDIAKKFINWKEF